MSSHPCYNHFISTHSVVFFFGFMLLSNTVTFIMFICLFFSLSFQNGIFRILLPSGWNWRSVNRVNSVVFYFLYIDKKKNQRRGAKQH